MILDTFAYAMEDQDAGERRSHFRSLLRKNKVMEDEEKEGIQVRDSLVAVLHKRRAVDRTCRAGELVGSFR